ncbi:MAG: META domain-containing protein [bacterium]
MNKHQQTIRIVIGLALLVGLITLMALYNGATPIDSGNVSSGSVTSSVLVPSAKLPPGSTPPPRASEVTRVKWIWKTTVLADGTVINPKRSDAFSVTLGADGRVQGTTDCNGFGGEYVFGSDGIISFGPFMSTQMYCEGSQEQDFTKYLMDGTQVKIDTTGSLIISIKDNGGQIVFTK